MNLGIFLFHPGEGSCVHSTAESNLHSRAEQSRLLHLEKKRERKEKNLPPGSMVPALVAHVPSPVLCQCLRNQDLLLSFLLLSSMKSSTHSLFSPEIWNSDQIKPSDLFFFWKIVEFYLHRIQNRLIIAIFILICCINFVFLNVIVWGWHGDLVS